MDYPGRRSLLGLLGVFLAHLAPTYMIRARQSVSNEIFVMR